MKKLRVLIEDTSLEAVAQGLYCVEPITGCAETGLSGYSGNFYGNALNKESGRYGKAYVAQLEGIGSQKVLDEFDNFAPRLAKSLRLYDERASKELAVPVSKEIQRMRKAIEEVGTAQFSRCLRYSLCLHHLQGPLMLHSLMGFTNLARKR